MEPIKAEEMKLLDEGSHVGKIIDVRERTEPFHYVDLVVKEDVTGMELKVGFPVKITKNAAGSSKLARTIEAFGIEVIVGAEYNPDTIFLGKRVQFLTLNQKAKDGTGTYARIVTDSLKPEARQDVL